MVAQPQSSSTPDDDLPEREQRILAFERQWWRHVGAKEDAIRAEFSLSAARYFNC